MPEARNRAPEARRRRSSRTPYPVRRTAIARLRLPFVFAALLAGAYGVTLALEPAGTGPIARPELRWLLAAALAAAGVLGVQAVRFLVLDVAFLRSQGHRAPALLHVVVALALYFVLGLVIASQVFGQSLTGAIATSAVASVVLGLALQETLGNFFAGISLQIGQPFRLGDVIRTGGHEGRVEAFNWRATTIRTVDDALVAIPNSLAAREAVEVHPRQRPTRQVLTVSATYDAPPQRVADVVRGAIVGVPGIAERPAPGVRVGAFGDSAVDYEVLYWAEDRMRAAAIAAQIRERVWYAFARNAISIPYPHQVEIPYQAPPPMAEDPAEERARWLDEVALLAPLAPEERQRLAAGARTLLYGPGETVLRAGAEGGSMFVVLRGRVEIRVPQEGGARVTVAEIASGEVMGEMSLLTGEPRSADARAATEVELLEVRRPEMKALLADNDALADALAAEMATRLSERADALARHDAEAENPTMRASLLGRIRRFFELG